MQLISDSYRALNAKAHQDANGYGTRGYKHLGSVLQLAEAHQATSILDYGCGQATLSAHARRMTDIPVLNYDPAIPAYAELPSKADIVVCTDVLEHVEPLCVTNVVQHIASLTGKAAFIEVACRPAKRLLDDGRNAHLLIRDGYFWLDMFRDHMDVIKFIGRPGHSVLLVCVPGGTAWK